MHALGQPLNVSQVPPPVTPLDVPPLAGATKVPEPVNLIFRPEGADPDIAEANATPPGLNVVVGKFMLIMAHPTWSACPCTRREPIASPDATANVTNAAPKSHLNWVFILFLLSLIGLLGFQACLLHSRLSAQLIGRRPESESGEISDGAEVCQLNLRVWQKASRAKL